MVAPTRTWLLLSICVAALVCPAANAQIPDPSHFTCPHQTNGHYWIDLVASRSGVLDPNGAFTVVARDIANIPIPGTPIMVVFTCPDLRIASGIVAPGVQVDCGPPVRVTAITDENGVASFLIGGAANDLGGNPTGCGLDGAQVYWNGVLICNLSVSAADLNGAAANPGVEITDLAAWLSDFAKVGMIGYKARSDYSHSGTTDVVDLSLWLRAMGRGTSSQGCAIYCP